MGRTRVVFQSREYLTSEQHALNDVLFRRFPCRVIGNLATGQPSATNRQIVFLDRSVVDVAVLDDGTTLYAVNYSLTCSE